MPQKILVIALAVAFLVVIERLFTLRRDQAILRDGWRTDVVHAFLSHLLSQVGLVVGIGLVFAVVGRLASSSFQDAVTSQPHWLQLVEAILVTDVTGYWLHRAAHRVPLLWRFHRVHHSSEALDWLASARVHPVDIVIVRSAQFAPLFLLGFSKETFGAYAAVMSLWALVLHANVRWRFGPLRFLFATPQFHHWHHSNDTVARDRNFAGQLPLLDALFGTLHLPSRGWPKSYGVDDKVPAGWARQLREPFSTR
jgi:sterol desaturase/sphingolipid hydroxylase (fatty acid hydroxylase superfamily)